MDIFLWIFMFRRIDNDIIICEPRSEFSLVSYIDNPHVEGKITSYFEIPKWNGRFKQIVRDDIFSGRVGFATKRIYFFAELFRIPDLFFLRNGLLEGKNIKDLVARERCDEEIIHGFCLDFFDYSLGEGIKGMMDTLYEDPEIIIEEYQRMVEIYLDEVQGKKWYKSSLHNPFVEKLREFFCRNGIEQKVL